MSGDSWWAVEINGEKSRSDLHAFGAERECYCKASPICDPARRYHGKF